MSTRIKSNAEVRVTTRKLREAIQRAKPTKVFEISLKSTADPDLKHLQVVTESWKRQPRWDRIGKISDALVKHMPIQEREHIVSISVFTKDEFAERTAFAKKMARISHEGDSKSAAGTARTPRTKKPSRIKVSV